VAAFAKRFESALWQTSSLLLSDGTEAVLVDPAVSAAEVARIAIDARELGVEVTHVLATHADWESRLRLRGIPGRSGHGERGDGDEAPRPRRRDDDGRAGSGQRSRDRG
jgi:hypothetical protein